MLSPSAWFPVEIYLAISPLLNSIAAKLCIVLLWNLAIFTVNLLHLAIYFWGGYAARLSRCIPWEGGWDTSVCRFSSIHPNSRILIENHPAVKASWRNPQIIHQWCTILQYSFTTKRCLLMLLFGNYYPNSFLWGIILNIGDEIFVNSVNI